MTAVSVYVRDCRGRMGRRDTVRVCTGSWLWEKNPLPHRGHELASRFCHSDFGDSDWLIGPVTQISAILIG